MGNGREGNRLETAGKRPQVITKGGTFARGAAGLPGWVVVGWGEVDGGGVGVWDQNWPYVITIGYL